MRLIFLSLLLLVGCSAPEGLRATPDGAGPTVVVDWDAEPLPELPFPNDLATRVDTSSPTGLRVNFSLDAATETEREARAKVNEAVGFGVFAPITVRFAARLDLDDLVARHADDGDFSDDAFYVVDITEGSPTYGQPVDMDLGHGRYPGDLVASDAYFANDPRAQSPSLLFETYDEDTNGNGSLDPGEDTDDDGILDVPNVYPLDSDDPREDLMTWYELETDTLIVRPILPLREETTYAVVLTERLRGEDGEPVRSPWDYVHHLRQTTALESLVPVLPDLGLALDDVGFAWTFTTAAVTRDLRDLRAGLYGEGPYAGLSEQYPPRVHTPEVMHDPLTGEQSPYRVPSSRLFGTLVNLGLFSDGASADVLAEGFDFVDYLSGASFTSPQLIHDRSGDGDTSDEWWKLDASTGEVVQIPGDITFTCVIPLEDDEHQAPFPTAIYGHGYRSSRFEGLAFSGALARLGIATCLADAPGHGPTLDPDDEEEIVPVLEELGLTPFLRHLERARDRDLNNDGVKDSGHDMWTSDPFHTRDMVRQMVVDWFQMVRSFRACGTGDMGLDIDGDGSNEAMCDWNADGVPDIGGEAPLYLMGGSLGGINSAVAAPLEPELDAISPVVPGAGLLDIGWRSDLNGVRQAAVGRVLSPFFLGRPADDGTLAVTQMVNSTVRMEELHVATLTVDEVSRAARIRVTNPHNGEVREHHIPEDGTFRIGIPADALTAIQKRSHAGMPETGPELGAVYEVPNNEGLGDTLEVEILDASGAVVRTITTFERDVVHEAVTMRAGSPLIAGSEGLGRLRGSPELRRLVDVLRMVLEPADPAAYAPMYHQRPFPEVGRATNVLVVPTPGDTVVNVATGVALARIAGMYDYRAVDERYGMSVDQWLIDRQVVRGLEEWGPWVDATGAPALFDADDLDEGSDERGVPSDAPLRASVQTESGVSGMRLPYISSTGSHGFGMPSPEDPFDMDTFALGQIGWWLATGGTELLDDHCFATLDCDFYRPLPETR